MTLFPRVMNLLKENDASDIIVTGGGIIPEEDIPALKESGISIIFGPGTPLDEIIEYHRKNARTN